MDKFCIFCGKRPESKNREHVIPQWLIWMTGDPNRKAFFGLKWTGRDFEKRIYSFSSFTFPACEVCNSEFSELETRTKPIMEAVLAHEPISAGQWDTFLDWMDKVRIGLWLGGIYLNENYRGLRPHFHIEDRIGSKDRFLIIYEIEDDDHRCVIWSLTETPLFECIPSCFILTVNNFLFFNASYDFLFSERFGFPFPEKCEHRPEGYMRIKMNEGTRMLHFPLVEKKFKTGGTQLFQPMIPYGYFETEKGEKVDCTELYDNTYVRANCVDFRAGEGRIFRRQRNQLVLYSEIPSKEWIPSQRFPRGEVRHQVVVLGGEFLEDLYRGQSSLDSLSVKEREEREREMDGDLQLHKSFMNHYIAQKDTYY